MVIAPCGIRIEVLVERMAKVKAMNHARHRSKVMQKKMPRDVAAGYDRFDAAVLLSLELLHRIEQHEPEVLTRHGHSQPEAAADFTPIHKASNDH